MAKEEPLFPPSFAGSGVFLCNIEGASFYLAFGDRYSLPYIVMYSNTMHDAVYIHLIPELSLSPRKFNRIDHEQALRFKQYKQALEVAQKYLTLI